MAKLSPMFNEPWADSSGVPYSGALLFCYAAGSSAKQNTYKDSGSVTPHANPIVLNAMGMPDDPIWLTEGETYKFFLAPSTDTDPPTSAIDSWDNIEGINDSSASLDQWISGPAPTFVSATSFTLVGDQTSAFHVGRKIKTTNTGGTQYHTILTSTYTSLTTITVGTGSGVLDSGLSAVSYGIISASNNSEPVIPLGADVASAAALAVDIPGGKFDVTGTTTITSINSKGVGSEITLQFDGALTLTHHATNLILPGGADITTAAGDIAVFYEYASGDWRCVSYMRALQQPGTNVVQVANVMDSAVATGTTVMPVDDTIPQNTEGTEFMTLAITPKSSSNKLKIEVVINWATTLSDARCGVALFQDSTANAIAAAQLHTATANRNFVSSFTHYMTAGTTSSTTFKVRAGSDSAHTWTHNGSAGGRVFGGVIASSITITEIAA